MTQERPSANSKNCKPADTESQAGRYFRRQHNKEPLGHWFRNAASLTASEILQQVWEEANSIGPGGTKPPSLGTGPAGGGVRPGAAAAQ